MADEWIPTEAPCDEARRLIADCTDRSGRLDKHAVLRKVTKLISSRNRYMERLGLVQLLRFRDVRPEGEGGQ